MVKGTVKWFNLKKGFGFISTEDGTDIFVHYSALAGEDDEYKTLNEQDKVEFDIVEGQKGPQASNIVVTEKAPPQTSSYNRGGGRGGGGYGGGGGYSGGGGRKGGGKKARGKKGGSRKGARGKKRPRY